MRGVLEGIRVLDWTLMIMGPHAGTMLGDLGAEVIKIEDRTAGDPMRGVKRTGGGIPVQHPSGRNLAFEVVNRSKKGITIDLKKERGRDVVYRLAQKSDVFLTNYRSDVARRLRMDYESLNAVNPRLIYAHASGFGEVGPDASNPGQDRVGQSRSGIMAMAMADDGDAPYSPSGLGDQIGAMATAYGVLAALMARERWGMGQEVQSSMLRAMMYLQMVPLGVALLTGREFKREIRTRAISPTYNDYRCADGKWLSLGMFGRSDKYWGAFCHALGLSELERDPRYDNLDRREQHSTELIALFDRIFAQKSRDEWLQILKEHDVVAAPVNRHLELPTDPQVVANEDIIDYDHPVLGPIKYMAPPVRLSETPLRIGSVAPEHGEHTEMVLLEVGGYSWEEIQELKDQEVV